MNILVFDRTDLGHEPRYLEVLSHVLQAESLLAPLPKAWYQLIRWRGPLVYSSPATKPFLVIAFLRHIFCRRTVGLFIRDPRMFRQADMRGWRQSLFEWVISLSTVRFLSIMVPTEQEVRTGWIYDLEWWDMHLLQFPEREIALPTDDGSQTVIFLGRALARKGIGFFLAAAGRSAERKLALTFVMVGDMMDLSDKDRAAFVSAGGIILPRQADDAAFVSYIRKSDWIWCCYNPDWHASSGLFGRALQLGKKSIVRKKSYLEDFQEKYGIGIAVEYGDADSLLDRLVAPPPPARPLPPVAEFAEFSIQRLRAACD